MKRLCASLIIGICIPALLTGCIVKKEETPATAQEERSGDDTEKRGAAGNAETEGAAGTESAAGSTEAENGADADADEKKGSGEVVVYNWGEYLDPEAIKDFEEETGIKVIYDEYETNEIMYPKVVSGASTYDLICPSDYMISKMLENDMLQPINFDHIPNYKNIDPVYLEMAKGYDPENKYSVPYCWGTIGILYNKSMIEEGDVIDSWSVLWDEKYKNSILMQDSVRDAFMVAEELLGYDVNTTDEEELKACTEKLIEQKPLVQAYVVDQARDKMIGGEAALGVIYSGEAIYAHRENPDLEYVIPKEGSNVWLDSWVIPKDARNVENAEKFLDFLCRPEEGYRNFEYITYSTPNKESRKMIEDEDIRYSAIAFPDEEALKNCDVFTYLGEDTDAFLAECWAKLKSS